MGRVIHFEIHASNPESLEAFYRAMFGWSFQKWEGIGVDYWSITTGDDASPGINGGLVRRPNGPPVDGQSVNAFVCTVEVPNVDTDLAKAQELGGIMALPKMAVPGVGWLAYIKDPDGNIIGLMQNDPAAAPLPPAS